VKIETQALVGLCFVDFMRIAVTKRIEVLYSRPVARCTRRLCIFPPPSRASQTIERLEWHCEPEPHSATEVLDQFGNRILVLEHRRIEKSFRLEMQLQVWKSQAEIMASANLPDTGIGAFLLPSALCDLGADVRELSTRIRNQHATANAKQMADAFCATAHHSIKYVEGQTDTSTTASQALKSGIGVCQDYAHVMIALCRAAALPSRYVSGYGRSEGRMHAWVEVLCGDNWQAWDPTHNRRIGLREIAVAVGRDYRDVLPVEGTFHGCAQAKLQVHCLTEVAGDT
jgi:transglutaminase-like putative cysteine protease